MERRVSLANVDIQDGMKYSHTVHTIQMQELCVVLAIQVEWILIVWNIVILKSSTCMEYYYSSILYQNSTRAIDKCNNET